MELPGWLWLAVGFIVTFVSFRGQNMTVFLWVGLVFIAIGLFKLTRDYMLRDRKSLSVVMNNAKYDSHLKDDSPLKNIAQCHTCKTYVYTTANFCHYCGSRLR